MSQHDNMARCLKQSKISKEGADVQVRCWSVVGGWIEVVKMLGKSDTDRRGRESGPQLPGFRWGWAGVFIWRV